MGCSHQNEVKRCCCSNIHSTTIPPTTMKSLAILLYFLSNALALRAPNPPGEPTTTRQQAVLAVVDRARALGPVANHQPTETQAAFGRQARKLEPLSDPKPAHTNLTGTHERLYSVSPGKKRGRIAQVFTSTTQFINEVQLGPLCAQYLARYEATNDTMSTIHFEKLLFRLFGWTVYAKPSDKKGVWKHIFVGTFIDHDGRRKRLRVMETPSLLLFLQDLDG